ncbi:hypothetical protein E2C01_008359 [Portunus trituberculatus]|uniref:Uncharacterized protein n=1 Tax=Portunus trituberculatus TaxID=210409 RepID=A0A5B7D5C8_PORTR|nr:hypothetical protein [Portunus trituberculatus]
MNIRKHMKPFTPKWRGTSYVPHATCHATQGSDLPVISECATCHPGL